MFINLWFVFTRVVFVTLHETTQDFGSVNGGVLKASPLLFFPLRNGNLHPDTRLNKSAKKKYVWEGGEEGVDK